MEDVTRNHFNIFLKKLLQFTDNNEYTSAVSHDRLYTEEIVKLKKKSSTTIYGYILSKCHIGRLYCTSINHYEIIHFFKSVKYQPILLGKGES